MDVDGRLVTWADTEARSIGLSVEACADTDVTSLGNVGDEW